jgi:hypothetical protein
MRKTVLLLALLIVTAASAQIKVKINDKPITEATILKAEDIKKMEVAFDKPKKLSYYGTGRLYFWVEFIRDENDVIEDYFIIKEGANAIEAFLADVNTYYSLPSDTNKDADFPDGNKIRGGSGINYRLMFFGKYYKCKTVKFRVNLGFRDKVGYQKYGDLVNLVKSQTYTIDNTTLYTTGQKEREVELVAENAKKAEDAKKEEEAQKEADKKQKAEKGKGLLRGVLNKI